MRYDALSKREILGGIPMRKWTLQLLPRCFSFLLCFAAYEAAHGAVATSFLVSTDQPCFSDCGDGGTGSTFVPTSGQSFTLWVAAIDADGHLVADYRGTVQLTSNDPATLPPPYTFTAEDGGIHAFIVTIDISGNGYAHTTLTARDTEELSGALTTLVVLVGRLAAAPASSALFLALLAFLIVGATARGRNGSRHGVEVRAARRRTRIKIRT